MSRPPARLAAAMLAIALASALPACGDDSELVVFAAASLSEALPAYAESSGREARFSFAGSDELAAQIRQGATPDVYAAANTLLPDDLHAEELVEAPVSFAANRLVLAVPADGGEVSSLEDAARPGVRLAIGDAQVPVGIYTREVLGRLPGGRAEAILANVRSSEPDVLGVVAKLTQDAVDAGFVYASDVRAAGERLRAIELPSRLRPEVAYGAAVATGAERPGEAERFVEGLLSSEGQEALRAHGFLPPS